MTILLLEATKLWSLLHHLIKSCMDSIDKSLHEYTSHNLTVLFGGDLICYHLA